MAVFQTLGIRTPNILSDLKRELEKARLELTLELAERNRPRFPTEYAAQYRVSEENILLFIFPK